MFSAVVGAAATSMGYTVVAEVLDKVGQKPAATNAVRRVELQIANTELVTDQLGRDQHITVVRDGVTVTFSRDARGQAKVCVNGVGETEEALRAFGEELSQRVVQQNV